LFGPSAFFFDLLMSTRARYDGDLEPLREVLAGHITEGGLDYIVGVCDPKKIKKQKALLLQLRGLTQSLCFKSEQLKFCFLAVPHLDMMAKSDKKQFVLENVQKLQAMTTHIMKADRRTNRPAWVKELLDGSQSVVAQLRAKASYKQSQNENF